MASIENTESQRPRELAREIAEPRSVLVIDDSEPNRALLYDTLTDEGYEVLEAEGGEAGLAIFERSHPDCVLLDVRMPDIDGLEVCRRIRALPHGPETPILIITALRDVETFDQALRAGADDFLTKPVRPAELVVRVQSALKLRKMNQTLREHYTLLKDQRDDLLRLQLQKERLMAFVVHDLKNPVNAMDLHAQLVLRDKNISESSRESAAHIRTEARQLNRMIMNLLDVARSDEGQLSPKGASINLRALIDEVLAEFGAPAEANGVKLQSEILVDVARGDEDLLRRTLANLLDNAIRYAPTGSFVTVTTTRSDNTVELRIRDSGRGIPLELRERIFDPFMRVEDNGPSSRTSRGLGLTFCKRAVEAQGGRIFVEDASPGTIFCVKLPSV